MFERRNVKKKYVFLFDVHLLFTLEISLFDMIADYVLWG